MNAREERGLIIAALCKRNRVSDHDWLVPSQSSAEIYKAIWKRLGGEFIQEDLSPLQLARMSLSMARYARDRGDVALARDAFAGAANAFEKAVQENPGQRTHLLREMIETYQGRAMCLVDLKDARAALPDWERVLQLDGTGNPSLRLGRALTLVRAGEHARATAEADELLRLNVQPFVRFALARIHARAASVVRDDPALGADDKDRLATKYAARAMELLKQVRATRLFQAPLYADRLKIDKDLDSLRMRDDFKELLANPTNP